MRPEIKLILSDMDGTVYHLDAPSQFEPNDFSANRMGKELDRRALLFFQDRLDLDAKQAVMILEKLKKAYPRQVEVGVEEIFKIPRSEFVNYTWKLDPNRLITPMGDIANVVNTLETNLAIVTNAPLVWAKRALTFLGIRNKIGDALFTSDDRIFKPDSKAFERALDHFNMNPQDAVMIGDEVDNDILPAQAMGMRTIHISRHETDVADTWRTTFASAVRFMLDEGWL